MRIECENVTKVFGHFRALLGVSLVLEAGTITVVEGPNGAGKSTLMSLLGGFVSATSGRVRWLGPSGKGMLRAEVRSRVGWVSHETMLYPDLSVMENVRLASRLAGLDEQSSWLRCRERFELEAFGARVVRACSRGQRQRAALARALVQDPDLVLLDEPTTGLDASARGRLLRVIREERERGAVVVVVTHEAELGSELAARVIRMTRGRVIEHKKDSNNEA